MPVPSAIVPPDDFATARYSLRPYPMNRQTKLLIIITMYNEDKVLFVKTMNAVLNNIAHLYSRTKSTTWGPDGWKKLRVFVYVTLDGHSKINQCTLKVLQLMGCSQDGIAKDEVAGKDLTTHIFEHTSAAAVFELGGVAQGSTPVQILFCLKEQNMKMLNLHCWFFSAFGAANQAERICVDASRSCSLLLAFPLAASQNFEYNMSNVLDKPLKSVFGYISVSPGAFSAYRYKALLGNPHKCILRARLRTVESTLLQDCDEEKRGVDVNGILACLPRVCATEMGRSKYVKSAKAATDVPTTTAEFISQRWCWLNGSFFAALHATTFQHRIWTSGPGFFRKLVLEFEFCYKAMQMVFAWTLLANSYLAFYFLVCSATLNAQQDVFNFLSKGASTKVFEVILMLYVSLLFAILLCSLGNRPQIRGLTS
ncbi:hypothetical protein BDV93DRAFT_556899 [Ceratobasidium sp. AG-I]|nr:hypothetical protein BDV93DRAFT_556899 [Ceratobasidium sp. AG-I]